MNWRGWDGKAREMMDSLFVKMLNCHIDKPNFSTFRIDVFLLNQTCENTRFAKLIIKRILFFLMLLNELRWVVHFLECHMPAWFFGYFFWFGRSFRLNLLSWVLNSLFFFFYNFFSYFWITWWVVFDEFQNVVLKKILYFFVSFWIVFLNFMNGQRINLFFEI